MAAELDPAKFDEEVKQSSIPVVLDFSASWCGPCKMLAPTLDKIGADYEGKAKVFKVDVDNARELATQFGIRSVPTLIFFKDGNETERIVGNVPYDQLSSKIDAMM